MVDGFEVMNMNLENGRTHINSTLETIKEGTGIFRALKSFIPFEMPPVLHYSLVIFLGLAVLSQMLCWPYLFAVLLGNY